MSDAPMPEPLESFLNAPPNEPLSAALRDELLAATAALLPRRRGWGRWPIASAVAASIVAAFIAGYFLGRNQEPVRQERVEHVPVPAPAPKPDTPNPPVDPKPPAALAKSATALELEWKAFDTDDDRERARLYFQAGDIYLVKHQDADAALRCYRQALRDCDAGELELRTDDNWLVTALKLDYRKEK